MTQGRGVDTIAIVPLTGAGGFQLIDLPRCS